MELGDLLDSRRSELVYVAAGVLLVVVAASALNPGNDASAEGGEVSLKLVKPSGNSSTTVDLEENTSVFQAVNSSHQVNFTEYDFGYLITSVDGLTANGTHNWLYSVNGEMASKSVERYYLEEGDNVTFRYTSESLQ